MVVAVSLTLFCLFQTLANLCFKWGSQDPSRWWLGVLAGTLLGVPSIYCYILIYRDLSPNLSFTLCSGGSFLVIQLTLWLVYREALQPLQWLAMVVVLTGLILFGAATAPKPL